MEQVSFGSIMRVLIRNANQNEYTNQTDLVSFLFEDFLNQDENVDYVLDEGWVCKCIKGDGGLDPNILSYYDHDEAEAELADQLESVILPMMTDAYMTIEDLKSLLILDPTIHEQKKRELLFVGGAKFAAKLLRFALVRKLPKPNKKALQMTDNGWLSPGIKGYISDDHLPGPCRWFQGRQKDAEDLHQLLFEQRKVFLRGIPGIGKSELAKYYVKNYRNSYTNTLYIKSTGDLRQDILNLNFADDGLDGSEEQRFQRHHRYLKTLREDTLLVIDNFNCTPDQSPLLGEVLEYRCRILFTTRCRYEDYETQEVKELPEEDLQKLILWFYPMGAGKPEPIRELIRTLYGHTLATELAARLLYKGLKTPEQLLGKLREEGQALRDANKIGLNKDGHSKKATYYDHMRLLFSFYTLDVMEQTVLTHMTLMPDKGIFFMDFAELLDMTDANALNELDEFGLLVVDDRKFLSLHPMIREIALADLQPTQSKCGELLKKLRQVSLVHGLEIQGYRQVMEIMENTVTRMRKEDPKAWLLFLEDAFCFYQKYEDDRGMDMILGELQKWLEDPAAAPRDRALLLSYQAQREKDPSKGILKTQEAIAVLGAVNEANGHLASNLHSNLGVLYHRNKQLTLAKQELETAIGLYRTFQFQESHDLFTQYYSYSTVLQELGDYDRAVNILTQLEQLVLNHEGECSLDHADVLEALGNICFYQGQKSEARNYYRRVIQIQETIFGDDPKLLNAKKQKMLRLIAASESLHSAARV